MRLPWISRESADAHVEAVRQNWRAEVDSLTSAFKATVGTYERQMVGSEARYAELMTAYRQLKLQGFQESPPPPTMPSAAPVDRVMDAVKTACQGKDAKVLKAMMAQVAIDRKAELPDETIILRIQRGHRVEEEYQ